MLWSAFLFGFLGSFHCAGMCSPIALSLSYRSENAVLGKIIYNFGRIITYAFLGAIIGAVGQAMLLVVEQVYVSVFFGVLLVLFGLFSVNLDNLVAKLPFFGIFTQKLASFLKIFTQKKGLFAYLAIGLLNGFLPCGLVYMALLGAVASGDTLNGLLYMTFFGLGTLPMMLGIALAANFISIEWRNRMKKAYPYFFILLGILLIYRGLSTNTAFIEQCHSLGLG